MIQQLETVLKALGEPTRLKIVKLLSVRELCVCELEAVLGISQPRISQHLRVLKEAGIVNERKERQRSFYSLAGTLKTGEIASFAEYMRAEIAHMPELSTEVARLQNLDCNEAVRKCKNSSLP